MTSEISRLYQSVPAMDWKQISQVMAMAGMTLDADSEGVWILKQGADGQVFTLFKLIDDIHKRFDQVTDHKADELKRMVVSLLKHQKAEAPALPLELSHQKRDIALLWVAYYQLMNTDVDLVASETINRTVKAYYLHFLRLGLASGLHARISQDLQRVIDAPVSEIPTSYVAGYVYGVRKAFNDLAVIDEKRIALGEEMNEVFSPIEPVEPGKLDRLIRWLNLGSAHYEVAVYRQQRESALGMVEFIDRYKDQPESYGLIVAVNHLRALTGVISLYLNPDTAKYANDRLSGLVVNFNHMKLPVSYNGNSSSNLFKDHQQNSTKDNTKEFFDGFLKHFEEYIIDHFQRIFGSHSNEVLRFLSSEVHGLVYQTESTIESYKANKISPVAVEYMQGRLPMLKTSLAGLNHRILLIFERFR
ncbi:hypothetical protein [Endozoicomonas montiporae]|uniref:hypothetical protein n=1 Tax=Endozoicomonas montiporae TaxID=1027273 RepID=UPI0011AA8FA3|nr:hypothetical protein [Endozoicomonas montiporae]